MQYSHIPALKKTVKLPHIGVFLKGTILGLIIIYIFLQLKNEHNSFLSLMQLTKHAILEKSIFYTLIPIALVPFNWATEALKWQILSRKITVQSFSQSFIGVLTGLSLGFISPQSIGEYTGRIWQIKHKRRSELIGAVFMGSMIQFMVSILFGLYGVYMFLATSGAFHLSLRQIWPIGLVCIGIILFIPFFKILNINSRFYSLLARLQTYFAIIKTYTEIELIKVITFSLVHYLIFALQFVLVLILFEVQLPFNLLFAGVSWVYAAKTLIPALNFLSDIGVREFSALIFFQNYQIEGSRIVLASLFVWTINVLIPTIAGALFVVRMRIWEK